MRKITFMVFLLLCAGCTKGGNLVSVKFELESFSAPSYVHSVTLMVIWENGELRTEVPLDTLETRIEVPPGKERRFVATANLDDGTSVFTGEAVKDILPDVQNSVTINMNLLRESGFVHDPLGDSMGYDINGIHIKREGEYLKVSIWGVLPQSTISYNSPLIFYILLDLDQNPSTYLSGIPERGEIGPDAGILMYVYGDTAETPGAGYLFNEWDFLEGGPFPVSLTGNKISTLIPILAFGNEDGFMDFTGYVGSYNLQKIDGTGTGRMPKGSTEPANPFYRYLNGTISVAGGSTLGHGGSALGAALSFPQALSVDASGNEILLGEYVNGRGVIRRVDIPSGRIYNLIGQISNNPYLYGEAEFPVPLSGISSIGGIDRDREGNIIFSDPQSCVIRKVNTVNKTSTVIGGIENSCGYTGNGHATSVYLNHPADLFVDRFTGDIYFIDSGNGLIRKIDTSGNITTIAGNRNPSCTPSEEASYQGPATGACLSSPSGMAPKYGTDRLEGIYIADTGNYIVRFVDVITGWIYTFAGTGSPGEPIPGNFPTSTSFTGPVDVYHNSSMVYIVDNNYLFSTDGLYLYKPLRNNELPVVALRIAGDENYLYWIGESGNIIERAPYSVITGQITPQPVAGKYSPSSNLHGGDGGSALYASFDNPKGLGVYRGDIFILETDLHSLYKISSADGRITRIAGNEVPSHYCSTVYLSSATDQSVFFNPYDLAVDRNGNVFVADNGSCTVKKVDFSKGEISVFAGDCSCGIPQDGAKATSSPLWSPHYIAVRDDGTVFVGMLGDYWLIVSIDPSGVLHHLAGAKTGISFSQYTVPVTAGEINFYWLTFIKLERDGSALYVGEEYGAIWKIDLNTQMAELLVGSGGGYSIPGAPSDLRKRRSALSIYGISDIVPLGNGHFLGSLYYSAVVIGFNRYSPFPVAGKYMQDGFIMGNRAADSLIFYPSEIEMDGDTVYILLNYPPMSRIIRITPSR